MSPDRWRRLARPLRPASTDPAKRDSEGGYCRPSSFLALERDGRNDAFAETETMGRMPPWRHETAPPVRVRVRGFCEHEPSRICHFAGVRHEPPQYGATAKAHDPVGARARSGRPMGESWNNKRRAERPFEAPGSIGCPWKDRRPRSEASAWNLAFKSRSVADSSAGTSGAPWWSGVESAGARSARYAPRPGRIEHRIPAGYVFRAHGEMAVGECGDLNGADSRRNRANRPHGGTDSSPCASSSLGSRPLFEDQDAPSGADGAAPGLLKQVP